MKRTMLCYRSVQDILSEKAFENYSWATLSIFLVCTNTGFYFQIEDFDGNSLTICTTAKALNEYFERVKA